MVREMKKWSQIRIGDRITTKTSSVLSIGRPNRNAKFQRNPFLSRVSTLTRDIDIAILSVRLSIRNVPVLDENGLTYCHSFFHHTVAQSF